MNLTRERLDRGASLQQDHHLSVLVGLGIGDCVSLRVPGPIDTAFERARALVDVLALAVWRQQSAIPAFYRSVLRPQAVEADSQCNGDKRLQNAPLRFCHFFYQLEVP